MKKSYFKSQLLFVGLFLLTANVFSQTTDTDTDKFTQFIKQTFDENLNNLQNGNNIAPFLKAFSDDCIWENTIITTNGKVQEGRYTKSNLRQHLMLSGNTPSLYVNWKITRFNHLKVRENTIYATFEVENSVHAGESVISKGKNMVQLIATPINNTFVITFFSNVQISDEIYKGECYINIQKQDDNNYNVHTYFPSGTDYSDISNTVNFNGADKYKVVSLKSDDSENNYHWNIAQSAISKDKLNGPTIATGEEQAIIALIKIEQQDHCLKMVRTFATPSKN